MGLSAPLLVPTKQAPKRVEAAKNTEYLSAFPLQTADGPSTVMGRGHHYTETCGQVRLQGDQRTGLETDLAPQTVGFPWPPG